MISGKRVLRGGKGQQGGFLPLLVLTFIMKVLEKEAMKGGRDYDNMDLVVQHF